jgi:putative hydroxymethylpyrimidine transport system substrate-binding protein
VREPRTIRLFALAICVAAAVTALGCGEKSEDIAPGEPQQLDLVLDFYVNPDHAGIYEALDRGFFDQAGLDVHVSTPSDVASPIREVAAGRADLAVSYEPEVLVAHDQGLPVVAVAALVQEPLTSLISTADAGIEDVEDLRGKTIATAGIPYQDVFLRAILEREGLGTSDVDEVSVGLGLLPAVLSGRADAMLGGFSNVEGVDLALRGADPRVVPVNELGIPTYDELVLVANSDRLAEDSESVRLFIAALEEGTKAAAKDPAGATDLILEAGKGLDPKFTAAELDETLPLLAQEGGDDPYGYMDPDGWERFAQFLADEGAIEALPEIGDVARNDLLPGQIPD